MDYNCEVIIKAAIQRCFSNKFMQAIVRDILERNMFQEENEPISLEFQSLKMEMGNRMKSDYYGFLLYSLIFEVPIYLPDFTRPKKTFLQKIFKALMYPIRMFRKRDPNPAPGTVSLTKMGLKGDFKATIAKLKEDRVFMYEVLSQNVWYTNTNAVHCIVTKNEMRVHLDTTDNVPFVVIPHDHQEYDLDWAEDFAALGLSRKVDFVRILVETDGECDINQFVGRLLHSHELFDTMVDRGVCDRNIVFLARRMPVINGNTCQIAFTAHPRRHFDNEGFEDQNE